MKGIVYKVIDFDFFDNDTMKYGIRYDDEIPSNYISK